MTADTKRKAVKVEVTLPLKGMVFKGEETAHRSFSIITKQVKCKQSFLLFA
jgi:hypothetical protein